MSFLVSRCPRLPPVARERMTVSGLPQGPLSATTVDFTQAWGVVCATHTHTLSSAPRTATSASGLGSQVASRATAKALTYGAVVGGDVRSRFPGAGVHQRA